MPHVRLTALGLEFGSVGTLPPVNKFTIMPALLQMQEGARYYLPLKSGRRPWYPSLKRNKLS